MENIICYGARICMSDVAHAMDQFLGTPKSKKCDFCGFNGAGDANYCAKCGTDIRQIRGLEPAEILEMVMARHKPPMNVELVLHGSDLLVGVIMASGSPSAEWRNKPEHYFWDNVRKTICDYVGKIGLPISPDNISLWALTI